jgi:hypothetical protein
MKRLLTLCLLVAAMALGGTGCAKSGSSSSPTPVPSGPPERWTGTALYTHLFDTNVSTSTQTFSITVTWAKDPNPNPAPPAGGARYLATGAVHVSWRQRVDIGRCTMAGDGDYPLPAANPTADPESQILVLGPDGHYQGALHAMINLGFLQLCANGPNFSDTERVELRLDIAGNLDGGRMHGEMPPAVLTTESLTSRRTGSWDFTAN